MQNRILSTIVAIGIAAGIAAASPIGTLDIAGQSRISATEIDYVPLGVGTGMFVVTGSEGAFSGLTFLTTGDITDLNIATAPPGPALAVPIDPFILVPTPGVLFSFNLEQILLGGGPSCAVAPGVGGSCSPTEIVPNTPFLLTQTMTGVAAAYTVRGTVTDLSDGTTAPYKGLFTMNFTEPDQDTVPELLSAFGPGGPGFVESSFSAQLNSVPEPASLTLVGIGLLILGARRWRKS